MPDPPNSSTAPTELHLLLERLERAVVGQRALLERLVIALLAGGHVLIEGVPGLAKTRAVQTLANSLGLPFRRIQFTPDLLPADLTGTLIYHPATSSFDVREGPIVTSVLLADEINRAPAKVQSALLEAMQEGQVTIGDTTVALPDPFYVLATQNPIEHEGTYPLPEAQLDRFLMKLLVAYPERSSELVMLNLPDLTTRPSQGPSENGPLMNSPRVKTYQRQAAEMHVADLIKGYIVDLVRATRSPHLCGLADLGPLIELGASPRASIGLMRSAQAHALLAGRDYVTPHDVKSIAPDVLRHRIIPSYEADAEGLSADDLLERILDHVAVP
jgi:MoxR-like ATPase